MSQTSNGKTACRKIGDLEQNTARISGSAAEKSLIGGGGN